MAEEKKGQKAAGERPAIEKIRYTTHHPSKRYAAENSFPHLMERIRRASEPERKPRRLYRWRYAAVAASVAFLLAAGYLTVSRERAEVQPHVLTTEGERKEFLLPDGSSVWLNAESRLLYTDAFGRAAREVELAGEAYFEVEKDAGRPFVVRVGEMSVRALGTKFNVRAYPHQPEIMTTLVEGSVRFERTPADAHGTVLRPGQQLSFRKESESPVVRNVDCAQYVAWKDGMLVFRQTPVKDAFAEMERAFRIRIVTANSALDSRKITGRFGVEHQPEDILTVMQETLPFHYEVKADTIFIK
ncbi:MAG: FecR domain-containing protein [Bacteroidales bacterium]|jgi:ferric-dicitrate binding protein FerR (iron transport regulator)|nr:FecR domain-containing protein [Bacteroidales bacterium]